MTEPDSMSKLAALLREKEGCQSFNKLDAYYRVIDEERYPGCPYGWQVSFHNNQAPERAIIAANQTGKTRSAAADIAIHCTGRYPSWWQGRRYDRPVSGIVAGQTNEDIRDIQQLALFGSMDEHRKLDGTGWVPRECIGAYGFRQTGVPNVLDTAKVKHTSGGWSHITFKSFEQKAVKFAGRTVDFGWCDEEPDDYGIWSELQTRVLVKRGFLIFTNTPLKGMSEIVQHFLDGTTGTWYVPVTWEDAPHISPEMREEWAARYPIHERDTRTKGIPMMGTGLVYPIPDEMILCEPFTMPDYFRRICGIDFGIDHPGAAAWIALDAEADIVYLYDCYKESGKLPAYHAQSIMARGKWIPTAWPHDGMQRDKGSGLILAHQYRSRGVNMLMEPACWDTEAMSRLGGPGAKVGAQSREAGVMEILERMHTGRFKVCNVPSTRAFMEEKRMLHRKDGQIVAVKDDIESALRYAVMMLRFAVSDDHSFSARQRTIPDDYDPLEHFSVRPSHVRTFR